MSDVEQYINRRKQTDSQFCQGFESGYLSFKLGVILSQAREEAGLTQEELARKLNWDKATVFNLEENVESVGISTLEKYVKALGKEPDRGTSWLNSLQHKLFGVFERKSSMQITPHC